MGTDEGGWRWWVAKKSVSKEAVQAPLESLQGDIHSIELVRRASSRDMRVSKKGEDYCGGRRLKVGWMKLPRMVKFNMHRRVTRSLKSASRLSTSELDPSLMELRALKRTEC